MLDDEVERLRRLRINCGVGALGADGQVQNVIEPCNGKGRVSLARVELCIDELGRGDLHNPRVDLLADDVLAHLVGDAGDDLVVVHQVVHR
eukprot:3150621-Pyramimonas_sp.AAC.1